MHGGVGAPDPCIVQRSYYTDSTSKCLPMRPGLLETQRWREPEGGCPALTEPSFSGRDDKRQLQPDALNAMHRCEVRNTEALGKSEVKE